MSSKGFSNEEASCLGSPLRPQPEKRRLLFNFKTNGQIIKQKLDSVFHDSSKVSK